MEGDEDPEGQREFCRWILLTVSADLPHLGTDGCISPPPPTS